MLKSLEMRLEMIEKYKDAITSMYEASGDDSGVCLDKLIYTMKYQGNPKADVYEGIPEGFDFVEFGKDYKELIKPL